MSYYRGRHRRQSRCSSLAYDKNEPYAVCFYLYNACLDMDNEYIIKEVSSAIQAFVDYTKALNKTERLSKVLATEIKNLERQNLLTPLSTPANKREVFDSCEIKFFYEQDNRVDHQMRRFDRVDEILVNLHRVLCCSKEPVFSAIINATIFCSNKSYALPKTLNLCTPI